MATSQEKIKEALRELLEDFPFSEINVSSVCAKADISRRTFTRHYASLEEVARDQVRDDVLVPADVLISTLPLNVLENSGFVIYTAIYRAIYAHRVFYTRVIESLGAMWLVGVIMEAGGALNDRAYLRNAIPESEIDYVQHFFLSANAMTIKWWIERGFPVTPEHLAELIMNWSYGHLESLPTKD